MHPKFLVAVLSIYKKCKNAFPEHGRGKQWEAVFPFKSWSILSTSALLPKKRPLAFCWSYIGGTLCLPFSSGAFLMLFTQLGLLVTISASKIGIQFYEKILAHPHHADSIPSAVYSMVEIHITSESVIFHYHNISSQKREAPWSQ